MKKGSDPIEIYLFDWGDTLMVDLPDNSGKMCDWEVVESVDGARETLQQLSQKAEIYVATGATESTETEIKAALARVGLSDFVTGYFCKANLGISKGSPGFLPAIIKKLGKSASCIAMVGDSLEYDIKPASDVGIKPIWLSSVCVQNLPEETRVIKRLQDLCN
jgi:putative hydrolase of the HAD superfamily